MGARGTTSSDTGMARSVFGVVTRAEVVPMRPFVRIGRRTVKAPSWLVCATSAGPFPPGRMMTTGWSGGSILLGVAALVGHHERAPGVRGCGGVRDS